jgi:hypothetical protein
VETQGSCLFAGQGSAQTGVSPRLLHYHGAQIYPLLSGSAANLAVPSDECRDSTNAYELTDQRGVARPVWKSFCSLGAYEGVDDDHIFFDGFDWGRP